LSTPYFTIPPFDPDAEVKGNYSCAFTTHIASWREQVSGKRRGNFDIRGIGK